MNVNTKVGCSYKVTVVRGNGDIEETPRFKNLITNYFFQVQQQVGAVYIGVGTGTTTPLVTDEQLQNPVGSLTSTTYVLSRAHSGVGNVYTFTETHTASFTTGSVVGTIGELGVKSGSQPANKLISKALIKDANGDPTTLELTADDKLIVTWYFEIDFDTSPLQYNTTINGNPTVIDLYIQNILGNNVFWSNSGRINIQSFMFWGNTLVSNGTVALPPETAVAGSNMPSASYSSSGTAADGSSTTAPSFLAVDNNSCSMVYNLTAKISEIITANSNLLMVNGAASAANYAFCGMLLHFNPSFEKTGDQELSMRLIVTYSRV